MTDSTSPLYISKPVLVLVGPTAVGKTALSLKICRLFNGEIVSVDSMQVYRFMDIGTAKATREERSAVPHHLIDIVDPDDEYNAARFTSDALKAIRAIHDRDALPVLTGGSGLYLKALKKGLFSDIPADESIREKVQRRMAEEGSCALHRELVVHDPISADNIHPNDAYRVGRALEVFLSSGVPLSTHFEQQRLEDNPVIFRDLISIGLSSPRAVLYKRIEKRTLQMFEDGLEKEVRNLLGRGYSPELKSMQSIGYRHMVNYIQGGWSLEETKGILARDTKHYAKRQFTWFNKDHSIVWKDCLEQEEIKRTIADWLSQIQRGGRE